MLWRPRRQVITFTNWAGNQSCRPIAIHAPTCEQDVADVLREARKNHSRVKVTGSGHGWSEAACTTGHMIRLDQMNRLLEVDRDAGWVTVEAGIRLEDLNEQLAHHGLALSNLGSIAQQTLAGAIATGTHGTGMRFGSLSTFVRGLRLVRADGEVMDVSRSDGDLFEAARLSLGCLGVLTRLTLRCEPKFDLEEVAYTLSFDDALDQMQALVDQHDHVKFWWLPYTDSVFVITMRRIPRTKRTRRQRIRRALRDTTEVVVNRGLFTGLLRLGAISPTWVPAINRRVGQAYFRPRRRTDRSDRIFTVAMPPVHREMEYGIPRDVAPLALRRLRELVRGLQLAVDFVVEARFVAHDSILLSPSYGRDSCHLGAYMGNHSHLPMYFDAFETLCRQLDGRPHWGKEFNLRAEDLRQRIPCMERFMDVRRALDPTGRFENAFTRRVFGV